MRLERARVRQRMVAHLLQQLERRRVGEACRGVRRVGELARAEVADPLGHAHLQSVQRGLVLTEEGSPLGCRRVVCRAADTPPCCAQVDRVEALPVRGEELEHLLRLTGRHQQRVDLRLGRVGLAAAAADCRLVPPRRAQQPRGAQRRDQPRSLARRDQPRLYGARSPLGAPVHGCGHAAAAGRHASRCAQQPRAQHPSLSLP
mmetsp:Transcript_30711/g.71592  ORF Transcript_30711/g.71592 Transcript_30711/m.71592 type:complete len:203 (+) Transcript_30711:1620-2228(+)